MRVIHMLRKPMSEGTTTANVLVHGTGALNIDACRISTSDNLNGGAYSENNKDRWDGSSSWRYKNGEAGDYSQPSGRWPPNVVMVHNPGCVKKDSGVERNQVKNGFENEDRPSGPTHGVWECESGCPVAAIDGRVGNLRSGVMVGMQTGWGRHGIYGGSGKTQAISYADSGGVSRFYKQVGGGSDE